MAEQSQPVEFVTVTAEDILPERQRDWTDFNWFATRAIGVVVLILVALLVFVV